MAIADATPKVLIIDDETAVRNALTRLLPSAEYEVTQAENAEQALQHLRQHEFDVVVSDICMPALSGVGLLRHIRRNDDDLPVILVTGRPDLATAAEAVNLRAFRYMEKPLNHTEFCDAVRRAVILKRLSATSRSHLNKRGEQNEAFSEALAALRIAHQPIVDSSGNAVGQEALMRGQTAALPNPFVLLKAAEDLDRMAELGLRIQQLAVETFPTETALLFLNVHPSELTTRTCATYEPLRQRAHQVVLEITERESLGEVPNLHQRIDELRELGFRIAVDDFGSGYSALNSVIELEPEFVKLDKQLVRGVDKSTRLQRVVEATAGMCRSIGVKVIAECVETEAEFHQLLELGCDWYQGYFFGRPELV